METTKQRIRQAARSERALLRADVVERAGTAVASRLASFSPYLQAESVLAYLAKDNEVPTDALIADALKRGKRVYLPRAATYEFVRYRGGDHLITTPAGLREPSGGEVLPVGARAAAFVPLLAWDEDGQRLGRGGGWYDRVLGGLGSTVIKIGVGYESQRRERLPHGPRDVVLDFILTEERLVSCRAAAGTEVGSQRRGA